MKKIICILLVLVTCFLIVGCEEAEEPKTSSSETSGTETSLETSGNIGPVSHGEITSWNPPAAVLGKDGLYEIIVNDYERPTDFSVMQARRNMTVLVEKEIVHSGKMSAKMICKKEYQSYTAVSMMQPMDVAHRTDFGNFKIVKKITFWIYNAQQQEMTLTTLLKFTDDKSYTVETELPSCEWYQVVIPIESSALPSTKNVKYLSFSYQPIIGIDTVFYIDDLCLHRTSATG